MSKSATSVWVVCAWTAYESDDILYAYDDSKDASSEADRLNAVLKKQPECPNVDDSDEIWERYTASYEKWQRKLPSPSLSYVHGFSVFELKVRRKKP